MKRFVFRLESVLRLRAFELDKARTVLAGAERERRARSERVDAALARAARGRALLDADMQQGADGERLGLRAMGEMLGRSELARVRRELTEFEPVVEMARSEVRAAHTRVRSLERLAEKQAEAHRQRGLALEQSQLEEIAMLRLAREKTASAGSTREGRS